ncbi:PH domain-containing protein [Candidatus Woesearchaeota archaeon]|nr:PH domain-containing protein [Candidatus Woesearchaeota archaeon]
MRELDKVLDEHEKVFWEGKPNFWPFFFSGIAASLFGIIFLVAGAFVLVQGLKSGNWLFLLFPHFWIGVVIVFGAPIYKALVYKHTYYAITNKRVLFQTGLIGRDFRIIDFDQITNAEVNVGVLDKLFSRDSGSILISTAGTFGQGKHGRIARPYVLSNIPDPYGVFKFFKKVSHAVKTDIQYPNKYRPKSNPGYHTALDPSKVR